MRGASDRGAKRPNPRERPWRPNPVSLDAQTLRATAAPNAQTPASGRSAQFPRECGASDRGARRPIPPHLKPQPPEGF